VVKVVFQKLLPMHLAEDFGMVLNKNWLQSGYGFRCGFFWAN